MNKTAMEWAKLQQSERESKRALLGKVLPALKFAPRLQDTSWYLKVIKNAAEFATLPTTFESGEQLKDFAVNDDVGGIAVITYYPVIGKQYNSSAFRSARSNPVYFALNEFLSQLRKRNSRVGGYEPSEVGIYLIGVTDIYENLFKAQQLLKLLYSNEALDKYAGYTTLRALGFDPEEMQANGANYENEIKTMVADAQLNLPLPYQLTYLKRKHYLATTILGDHAGDRRQLYMFWKPGYFIYSDVTNELIWTTEAFGPEHPKNFGSFLRTIQHQIDEFKDSSTVSGFVDDFRSGVDESKFYKFPEFNLDPVEIDSSDEKLDQIHNMMTVDGKLSSRYPIDNSLRIWVNSRGWLVQGLKQDEEYPGARFSISFGQDEGIDDTGRDAYVSQYNSYIKGKQFPLNYFKPRVAISAEDNIVATRLRTTFEARAFNDSLDSNRRKWTLRVDECGTEVVSRIVLFRFNFNSNRILESAVHSLYIYTDGNTEYESDMLKDFSLASHYDWMPLRLSIPYSREGNDFNLPAAIAAGRWSGEFATYIPVSEANLATIHANSVKSEFFIEPEDFLPPVR